MRNCYFIFLLAYLLCTSCHDEVVIKGPMPEISYEMSSGRFRIYEGEVLTIVPTFHNTDETTQYVWYLNGRVVSKRDYYTFGPSGVGEYFIRIRVSNRYGSVEDEVKVTVIRKQQDDEQGEITEVPVNDSTFSWRFPQTSYNLSVGRSIKIKAYFIENDGNATYTWKLDDKTVKDAHTHKEDGTSYVFHADIEGKHTLQLVMKNDTCIRTQNFDINVCPAEGSFFRTPNDHSQKVVDKVYEYMPAPGHQVNGYTVVGDSYPDGCTMLQACDSVLKHFQNQWMVSLGGCGGYVIAGFDHSISARGIDGKELAIKGNPYSYQSEPGIVWVSQDENGDGLPNDTWYELAGSEYENDNTQHEYGITYFRPSKPNSATVWRDVNGDSDIIPYMSHWNPHPYYWQDWLEGNEITFFGTRLVSHHTYEDGSSTIPAYPWGYADNGGIDYTDGVLGKMGYFSISNARTYDGQPAYLQYIDFVRIQTAQYGWTPNLGEISTEVYSIMDASL